MENNDDHLDEEFAEANADPGVEIVEPAVEIAENIDEDANQVAAHQHHVEGADEQQGINEEGNEIEEDIFVPSEMEDTTTTATPIFRGLHSEDPDYFLRKVDWWLITKGATSDRARIAYIAGMLKDSAALWFNGLLFAPAGVEGPGIRTYDEFKDLLRAEFRLDPGAQWREQANLSKMLQGEHQSVEDFIIAVEKKGQSAHASSDQIKGAVMNGLKDAIKATVMNHEIATLADIKKWALVGEQCCQKERSADLSTVYKKLDELSARFDTVQLRSVESPAVRQPPHQVRFDPPPPRSPEPFERYARTQQSPGRSMDNAMPAWRSNRGGSSSYRGRGGYQSRNFNNRGGRNEYFNRPPMFANNIDCAFCGRQPPCNPQFCRARNQSCHTCNRVGHFAIKCRQRNGQARN